jgi:phage shock protein E
MKPPKLVRTLVLVFAFCVAIQAVAKDITWIDVRTPEEFNQGHVTPALNMQPEEILAGVGSLNLPKDAVIYLYCRTGRRAGIALETLAADGYTEVVNLGSFETALAVFESTANP